MNNDSEQCTESKLGQVHNAHTHGPGCARTTLKPRARRALGVVSWLIERRIVAVPGRVTGRVAALYRSLAAPYRDTKGRPQPRYKLLYPTHLMARPCARAPLALRAGRPCRGAVSQGLLVVSWPPAACPDALCHDTKIVS